MAEALNKEVEKGSYLGHAMPALRIDGRKRHRLNGVAFGQDWFETAITDCLGDEQVSEAHNPPTGDGKPQGRLSIIDQNSSFDLENLELIAHPEGPTVRGRPEIDNNAIVISKFFELPRYSTPTQVGRRREKPSPNFGDFPSYQPLILNSSGADTDIGILGH
jgi:hypothetical protein